MSGTLSSQLPSLCLCEAEAGRAGSVGPGSALSLRPMAAPQPPPPPRATLGASLPTQPTGPTPDPRPPGGRSRLPGHRVPRGAGSGQGQVHGRP
jgi:hypothetical protein